MISIAYSSYVYFFFQAEDGIRDLVRSRGLGDVYKRQIENRRNKLREFFATPEELKNSININLAKEDLQIIIDKGNQYGLNLSLIHI